jgi:hypothetical protein
MGLESSIEWAAKVGSDPTCAVNAMQIRMLHALWQGALETATRHGRQAEILRVQNSNRQWSEGSHLIVEVVAYAVLDDLTRVRQLAETIAPYAHRFPGWRPVLHLATGEYHRIRGDCETALLEIDAGLQGIEAGEHQVWGNLAASRLRILFRLDRVVEAVSLGREYVARAEAAGLSHVVNYIRMGLALAEARSGEIEAAERTIQLAISQFESIGTRGLNLALAYEVGAHVAIFKKDKAGLDRFATLAAQTHGAGGDPLLAARTERLRAAADRFMSRSGDEGDGVIVQESFPVILSAMRTSNSTSERAHAALSCLVQEGKASGGYLYLSRDGHMSRVATMGRLEPPPEVGWRVEELFANLDVNTQTNTGGSSVAPESAGWPECEEWLFRPLVLTHYEEGSPRWSGVVVLIMPRGSALTLPFDLVAEVSAEFGRHGDLDLPGGFSSR